ncbi:hypothetical protein BDQ17DRAFT_1385473 [Cyathus striatus]|nr:hypothetical protein BDQ17DRAFT_1385473 [Cyathus striatus]
MGQISLEKAYLISAYFESTLTRNAGLFLCLFAVTLYLYFNPTYNQRRQNNHTSHFAIMFFVATFHLAINCYRLIQGYVDKHLTPSGTNAYLTNNMAWHFILKDIVVGIQQELGSAAAIYRTWVLWSYDWKVVVVPIVLLSIHIIAGILISASLYTKAGPIFTVVVYDRLVRTYLSIAFALSVITVGLMSYRIWTTHRNAVDYHVGNGRLLSIMWILIESAALQIITEFILLVSICAYNNSQYVVLEWITPLVGITFNSVTVRIKLQSLKEAVMQRQDANNPVQTIGSVPLRHFKINIAKEVENYAEDSKSTPESSV